MEIKRNEAIEEYILKTIQTEFSKREREGIHLSDLLSPKQAYWRKIKPLPPIKKEVIYWLSGQAHEAVFLYISNWKHGQAEEWEQIWFTPDSYISTPNVKDLLTEMKTTRRGFLVKEGQEAEKYSHYLKQLRAYCAMKNRNRGMLFVWYLILMDKNRRNTEPDYFCYEVTFTDKELKETKAELLKLRDDLLLALSNHNIEHLPECEPWMCYKERKSMVVKPFCYTCNEGEGREFETDWGLHKHINSKIGKGHKVKFAEYEVVYEPRCKYSKWCKPHMYEEYEQWKQANQDVEEEGEEE